MLLQVDPTQVPTLLDLFATRLLTHPNDDVVLGSMRTLSQLMPQLGGYTKSFFSRLIDLFVDLLGDKQQLVRDFALDAIIKMMGALGAMKVFDRVGVAFKHKNSFVREHYMICFVGAVSHYGPTCLSFGAFLPRVVKYLSDPAENVREAAAQCLEIMFQHSGSQLVAVLDQFELDNAVLDPLLERFQNLPTVDDNRRIAIVIPPILKDAVAASRSRPRTKEEENKTQQSQSRPKTPGAASKTDDKGGKTLLLSNKAKPSRSVSTSRTMSRTTSKTSSRNLSPERGGAGSALAKPPPLSARTLTKQLSSTSLLGGSSSGNRVSAASPPSHAARSAHARSRSGSLDRDDGSDPPSPTTRSLSSQQADRMRTLLRRPSVAPSVMNSSRDGDLSLDIKPVFVSSERELAAEVHAIADTMKDTTTHNWEKRVKALHRLCGLVLAGAAEYPTFADLLNKRLYEPVAVQVTELRSQVCREACASVAFMGRQLRDYFQFMADYLIPQLFKLTYVSIAVIAESGNACIISLLKNVRVSKAIPAILTACSDRNDALRTKCVQYLLLVLDFQETSYLNKYAADSEKTARKLLADRNEEVRIIGRSVFWAFRRHWPDKGDQVLRGLDEKTQRLLAEEKKRYAEEYLLRVQAAQEEQAGALPVASRGARGATSPTGMLVRRASVAQSRLGSSAPLTITKPPADGERSASPSVTDGGGGGGGDGDSSARLLSGPYRGTLRGEAKQPLSGRAPVSIASALGGNGGSELRSRTPSGARTPKKEAAAPPDVLVPRNTIKPSNLRDDVDPTFAIDLKSKRGASDESSLTTAPAIATATTTDRSQFANANDFAPSTDSARCVLCHPPSSSCSCVFFFSPALSLSHICVCVDIA